MLKEVILTNKHSINKHNKRHHIRSMKQPETANKTNTMGERSRDEIKRFNIPISDTGTLKPNWMI